MQSAAEFFGTPWGDASDTGHGGAAATVSTEPASQLHAIEGAAGPGQWYQHPTVAIAVVVLGTAALVAHSTRPVARGSAGASLGPAKGSIEGEI
jgi:hypothetical protein